MYAVTAGVMLLLALCETWLVTIWQPINVRIGDWQYLVANWFAFPYTVYFRQDEQLMIFTQLGVIIAFGNLPLFLLVSPQVVKYSADMVFWSAQIRMHAFYIIFSFHLIVILIFLLIVFCFDLLQHYFSK